MAFKGTTEAKVIVQDIKLYTGIVKARILAINPTLEELNKIGIPFQNEITYLDQSLDGDERVRLDFWLHCTAPENSPIKLDIKTKVSFFITNRFNTSKEKGTTEVINSLGQTCWANVTGEGKNLHCELSENQAKWFKTEGMRVAFSGESQLTEFLRNWLNASREDELCLSKPTALFKGDFSELKGLVGTFNGPGNIPRVMLTVTEKGGKYYQSVFNRFFARWNSTSHVPWSKYFAEDSRNRPKDHYTFELAEFNPKEPSPDDTVPEGAAEKGSIWNQQ